MYQPAEKTRARCKPKNGNNNLQIFVYSIIAKQGGGTCDTSHSQKRKATQENGPTHKTPRLEQPADLNLSQKLKSLHSNSAIKITQAKQEGDAGSIQQTESPVSDAAVSGGKQSTVQT